MDWNSLATQNWILLGSGGVALGILLAALVQVVNMKRAIRSEAYSGITADLHALDTLLITDPTLDQLLDNVSPTGTDEIKQRWLVFWYLDLYENVHFQWGKCVIPKELWQGWENEIKQTCKRPGFKKQYEHLKAKYNEDFQKFIGEQLN